MAEKENIKDKLENLKEGHRKSNKDIIESLFAILGLSLIHISEPTRP